MNSTLYGGIKLCGEPDLSNVAKLDLLPMTAVREMVKYGMAIDIPHLVALTERLQDELLQLRYEICSFIPLEKLDEFMRLSGMDEDDDAYSPMNVDSAVQLRRLLFDVLGVGAGHDLKLTKSGLVSTGKRQLEARKRDHEVVQRVLDYRERAKLVSTYTSKLPRLAKFHGEGKCWCGLTHRAETWRIHCEIMMTRTATGRPACVAWWTKVLTKRGYVLIKDIRVGDEVWTHRLRWRRVIDTIVKSRAQMYDVRFSNGEVLTCTADHRLLMYADEHIESVVKATGKYTEGFRVIPQCRESYDSRDRGTVTSHLPYSTLGLQESHTQGRIQSTIGNPVCTLEDSREESDVWQEGRGAPQLDRFSGRWARISDLLERRGKAVCPSSRDGRIIEFETSPRELRRASYRWRYQKQRARQLGVSDTEWPQGDSQVTAERRVVHIIEEIAPSGCFEVFDIEVEEDRSYYACGVFSHNTKNPNLQNIPVRSEHGRAVRAAFVASPGTEMVTVDFSQLELRLLAHFGNVSRLIWVFEQGLDPHTQTAMDAFGLSSEDEVDKLTQRAPAKNVNFAMVYGETAQGLYEQLVSDTYGKAGIAVPDWLTLEWCEEFLAKWFDLYPEVRTYMSQQHNRARRYGCVWTGFGRIRRVPEVRSVHKRVVAAGLRQAGNMPIQGTGADMLKLAQAEIQEFVEEMRAEGIWCWPLNEVHDELIYEVEQGYGDVLLGRAVEVMEGVLGDLCRVPVAAEGKVMMRWEK